MTTFDDRKKGHEAKFAHDQETLFKITSRRNKLLGEWAAELMGLSGNAVQDYIREVVAADFEEPGAEDVFRKLKTDLEAKGVDISEHRIRRQMDDCFEEARRQVTS
jgi:hypothetical protein